MTTKSQEIETQQSLSPEIFNRFINLSVGLSLSGSASYSLAELEKVLRGEQLQRGSELVITARYYVADVHMPVSRDAGYDYGPGSRKEATYKLGGAKLDTKLIKIEKIDVKGANLEQSIAERCTCLVPNEPNIKKPEGYHVAEYPLTAFWAKAQCPECHGKGYVLPKKNKAPFADRIYANGVIILVDALPEPPDIPKGGCEQCGETGTYHKQNCPVKAELEAAAKKALAEAKKAYKAASGKKAPGCLGDEDPIAE